jgi:amidase
VSDAALVLNVLQGIDNRAPAERASDERSPANPYLRLRTDALRGVRIGFPRHDFSGDDPEIDSVINGAIKQLQVCGATVVDIDLPKWLIPLSSDLQRILVQTESVPSLNAYLLASFPPGYPRSHAEILAMSEMLVSAPPPDANPNPGRLDGYRWEGSAEPPTNAYYIAARDQGRQFFKTSMQAILEQNYLDAIVYPTQISRINKIGESPKRDTRGLFGNFGPTLASLAGWPELTIPAGFTLDGLPVGISIMGPQFSDQKIVGWGFAFEQRTHALRQPATTPSLPGERFTY